MVAPGYAVGMDAPADPLLESARAARAAANAAQRRASDPGVSAFVSASAGSGKTKLLTDRLLRLMLGGADPARIQCLTYTRAAAAEMALRLQAVLGGWVTLDDAALAQRLRLLDVTADPATLARARALFARVLDLPGGMRIGTIHAFCQSLLRRFPLEASLSPHFGLLEDRDAGLARAAAEETELGDAPPGDADAVGREARVDLRTKALHRVAGMTDLRAFDAAVKALIDARERLARLLVVPPQDIQAHLDRAVGLADEAAGRIETAVSWPAEPELRAALGVLADEASSGLKDSALVRLDWLSLPATARAADWPGWRRHYLRQDGKPCGSSSLVNLALARRRPDLLETMLAEQARVVAADDAARARALADLTAALLALALPVARRYAAAKDASIRLDYADLIERTELLLRDPGAAWVLYKLDGGLDHLLLDEVQDTAPAQWAIAGALAHEFFAGEGAREAARTIFAVGDRKQSIFSFQGAEPAAFDHWQGVLHEEVRAAGRRFADVQLEVSFRSAAPVLQLVDAVFADAAATPGVGATRHRTDRAGQAGRVELWPLAAPASEPELAPDWSVPAEPVVAQSAASLLAERLTDWIEAALAEGTRLPSRARALRPGDILILVRRRNDFVRALVRRLKQRGIPVAGLDRMVLTDQPAVADLLTLCDVLLLPSDDLSLACFMTSPLGGLDDEDLIALAPGRAGSLWDALHDRAEERPAWRDCAGFLDRLFARVDYVTPHALLAEILGAAGGRARLLARLGPEAAEPIDELLAAALSYARAEPPSLQGFLHWLRGSAAEVKREAQAESAGVVRVMTVHGAKGLQAPLVILPDTTALPDSKEPLQWVEAGDGVEWPLWCPHADLRCDMVASVREAAQRRRTDEYDRLLYVALTRAEDWLIVCGARPRRNPPETCWYERVAKGMARLPAQSAPFGEWGELLSLECAQTLAPDRVAPEHAGAPVEPLPDWAGAAPGWVARPPAAEPATPARLAPSRPEHAAFGPAPPSLSPLDAAAPGDKLGGGRFARGRVLHALLQHLPDLPEPERAVAARAFLARAFRARAFRARAFRASAPGLRDATATEREATLREATLREVLAVLAHPALAPLFGPGSRAEAPLAGVVGGLAVGGLVDRVAVLPDRVLIADYKTNARPPRRPADVPVLYLRQMAAYRAVLRAAYPGREVACVLVWTVGAVVMQLPADLLDRHAPGTQGPGAASVDPSTGAAHVPP